MPGCDRQRAPAAGAVAATASSLRARRGAPEAELVANTLMGTAWLTGFVALTLAIFGLTTAHGIPTEVQDVLWPAGSAFVVGLICTGEGAARRNKLHDNLGSALALIPGAALMPPGTGTFWVLAVAGGGAYVIATALERRRIAALR